MASPADLAAAARGLRDALRGRLAAGHPGLRAFVDSWRDRLNLADDAACADALAQMAAFGCLLAQRDPGGTSPPSPLSARGEGEQAPQTPPLRERRGGWGVRSAIAVLADLASDGMPVDLRASLQELSEIAGELAVDGDGTAFYEAFLTAYDPAQRRSHGAYYTPAAVVRAQVRWADQLLRERLGFGAGLAAPDVAIIDPAMGTGAYLLGVVEQLGPGSWADKLVGLELMPGPYAVAELQLARALDGTGARPRLALGDALARRLEIDEGVRICLGNPPYARHDAGDGPDGTLLAGFVATARAAGHGGDLKNLYNLYVYFWAWALREVFRAAPEQPGLISFITASSYLAGDAFVGLRETLRRECDEVWIVDLGGEGRGARQDANIFAVQTPVAIAVAWRAGPRHDDEPARVRYAKLSGSRIAKLAQLDAADSLAGLAWSDVPDGWQAPFLPAAPSQFAGWPRLVDLLPWQHSGVQPKRTWPIAPDPETLRLRWAALLVAEDRAVAMRATGDRTPEGRYAGDPAGGEPAPPIASLAQDAPAPAVVPYQFRSFDRQWLLADGRLLSRPRPAIWQAHSERQRYFATTFSLPPGHGPALTVSRAVPDLHVFCGRGAKDILPLYRDAARAQPNLAPGLLEYLATAYGRSVSAEEFAGYVYGLLAHPGYTTRFYDALASASLHVPLTRDARLFKAVSALGGRLLELHTAAAGTGAAACIVPIPAAAAAHPETFRYDPERHELAVGEGRFAPLAPEVMAFEVSGLKVVDSWLGYRIAKPRGKGGSPLDEVRREGWPAERTSELLELLWTIEGTLALYLQQASLLEEVLAGSLVVADELPVVPANSRKPPGPMDRQPSLDFG